MLPKLLIKILKFFKEHIVLYPQQSIFDQKEPVIKAEFLKFKR